jgi:hypothetical protein
MLGVDPARAVGFEDTASGLASLHAAGVGSVVHCRNHACSKSDALIDRRRPKAMQRLSPEAHVFRRFVLAWFAPQAQRPEAPATPAETLDRVSRPEPIQGAKAWLSGPMRGNLAAD